MLFLILSKHFPRRLSTEILKKLDPSIKDALLYKFIVVFPKTVKCQKSKSAIFVNICSYYKAQGIINKSKEIALNWTFDFFTNSWPEKNDED